MINNSGLAIAFASIILCSQAAVANDLRITNNTSLPSTTIINHAFCSNMLGASGITEPGTTNVVSQAMMENACWAASPCQADVYMTRDCSGPIVGTVLLTPQQGIISVTATSDVRLDSNSFQLTLSK